MTIQELKLRIADLESAISLRKFMLRQETLTADMRRAFEQHIARLNQQLHLAQYRVMLDEFTS